MDFDLEAILGIKAAVLKTGAAGAVIGVIWRRDFDLKRAVPALLAGIGTSVYIVPGALSWAAITAAEMHSAAHFLGGLLGMYLIDGLVVASKSAANNPLGFWRKLRNPESPDEPPAPKGGNT